MANNFLYPPIVNDYEPAFVAGLESKSRIYFSLSKFNIDMTDEFTIHATVKKQDTGQNLVKMTDANNRYRSTGIILNIPVTRVTNVENLYYIDILNDDIDANGVYGGLGYDGFIPGWVYQIQLRISAEEYDPSASDAVGQAQWLKDNASQFSEWSTVCMTKSIGPVNISIPFFNYTGNEDAVEYVEVNNLYFAGKFNNADKSETLYSYKVELFDQNLNLLDQSGLLYSDPSDINQFKYEFKINAENHTNYIIKFTYTTLNNYSHSIQILGTVVYSETTAINFKVLNIENDKEDFSGIGKIVNKLTSVSEEEEEGRILLKLYDENINGIYTGTLYLKRASSKDNFMTWTDIKKFTLTSQKINELPPMYDYTIESGVWYKYGIQNEVKGIRGQLQVTTAPAMRDFECSYLLGPNNQQLKLQFNESLSSYKINVNDSKVTTLAGEFPFVFRNGASKFKTFSLNGLISFYIDEKNTFTNKLVVYKYDEIKNLYEQYNIDNGIDQYDFIYEREFRKLVMDFLNDGKPKLFKSRTEGNIIVRLTDISFNPEQSIGRIIYSFSSTANEIARDNMDNYLKYKFYTLD